MHSNYPGGFIVEHLHVLVVEAEADGASQIATQLVAASDRFRLLRAPDLESALTAIYSQPIDVLIADVELPDARGLDAVRILRDQAAEIPLIVCTHAPDETLIVQALRLGAQDVIDRRTLDPQGLRHAIRFARERQRFVERIARSARSDALTHLHNWSSFRSRVRQAIARAKRNGRQVGVIYLDLDGFKEINDRFGHAAGDRVLCEVASRLVSSVRENDTVARLGGDELAVLLEDIDGLGDAEEVAHRAAQRISEPVPVGNRSLVVTASLGIALYPSAGTTVSSLIAAADDAMYAAKRGRQAVDSVPAQQSSV